MRELDLQANAGKPTACLCLPQARLLKFIDLGIPYDPLAKPYPDITLSAKKRKIGRLGVFMKKKSMDDMWETATALCLKQ